MIFESPFLLMLAPMLGALVAVLTWQARRRRIRLAGVWSPALERAARANGRWGPIWLGLVAVLLGVALAGPRGGRTEVTTETRALSLVMAVDVSRSMLAEDVAPSRLARAVGEGRRLVHDLPGDRVGLIAFAGRSYILSPLTIDGAAITLQLDALSPDMVTQGGTSLAAALTQGAQLLEASTEISDRVLVVFTDGEAHDSIDAILRSAEAVRESGIRLVLVAEGTTEPTRIPIRDSAGNLLEYKQTREGEVVETVREDEIIRRIAAAGDGTVIPADVADQAGAIRDLTMAFKRNPTAETRTADLLPLAWIPLLIAALVLLFQTMSRRTASLVALAAVVGASGASAQLVTPAERLARTESLEEAGKEYLELAREGFARDTSYYNAGAVAIQAGDLEGAMLPLQQAANSVDPDLRFRALYNLGTSALMASRLDTARAEALRQIAVERLREALLLQPGSPEAKWNLELALRAEPPPPDDSGGGGASPPPPPSGPQDQDREANPQPTPNGLTQSQAEQILNSVEREEQATRSNQQRRRRGTGAGGGKDW